MSILALQRIETQHCQVDGCGQQVEQIRQDARTQNEIAVAYGVSQSTISRIQTKQIWDSTKRSRTRGKI